MKKVIITIGLAAVLLSFARMAQAEWITIRVEAVVDNVADSGNNLGGKVNVGDTITGWYTYDTSAPDHDPEITIGDYWFNLAPAVVSLHINDLLFETNPENVQCYAYIMNDRGAGDIFSFSSTNNIALSNGTSVDSISFLLEDITRTALSSDALPTGPPNLDLWQYKLIRIGNNDDKFRIDAHLTSAVPEPTTLALFAFGALDLLFKRFPKN
jgi:PEP-CTERM motif